MSDRPTIEAYRLLLQAGGGSKAVDEQRKRGKMTARERIGRILDPGSFVETDVFLGSGLRNGSPNPAEGVIAGFGTAGGRPVCLYAHDFTVMSGSVGRDNAAKVAKVMDLAVKTGVPVISLADSSGARLEEGAQSLEAYASLQRLSALASGVVPQITVVCGPCIGAAAVLAGLSDFVFSVEGVGLLYTAGPEVLEASGVKDAAKKALDLNRAAGLIHFAYPGENECFAGVRRLLSFLPGNNLEDPPCEPGGDDMNRTTPQINDYSDRRDMYAVITAVADRGDFMECLAGYGPSLITGFARINGRPAGIAASNPRVREGRVDAEAADKHARFTTVCDAFNLPVVSFMDTEGLALSPAQEQAGLVRACARMLSAYAQATVPKIAVAAGNAIGNGWLLMGGRASNDLVFAWPEAVIAPLEPAAAALIIYRDRIASSQDATAAKTEYARQYASEDAGALTAARTGIVDDIFDPESTRPMVAAALEMLVSKRENRMPKKRGTL